jgi:uncharacterized membrane protein YphA (DoxX/SURF4 family)
MVERKSGAKPFRRGELGRVHFILFHGLRLFLGAVFLYAGSVKILQPDAFAEAVYRYQILPGAAVNLAAITLPWMEVSTGLCLIAGLWLPGAVLLSTSLLGVFIGALVFNLIRGLNVQCGCFSAEITHGPADVLTIARDLLFLAISIYLAVFLFFEWRPFPVLKRSKNVHL